ncbi:MAG TPA: hypothetical protein VNB22_11845 [Pyrinomonadaceae bacterium]|nr:hypothetical protein [Pyrinomonadaceae bacterium]
MEIAADPASGEAFTTLLPRQSISSAPNAVKSLTVATTFGSMKPTN